MSYGMPFHIHYNLHILDIRNMVDYLNSQFGRINQDFNISLFMKEPLYDWCIQEAFHRVMFETWGAVIHQRMDGDLFSVVYDTVYDGFSIGSILQSKAKALLEGPRFSLYMNERIKFSIFGSTVIMGRGHGTL